MDGIMHVSIIVRVQVPGKVKDGPDDLEMEESSRLQSVGLGGIKSCG